MKNLLLVGGGVLVGLLLAIFLFVALSGASAGAGERDAGDDVSVPASSNSISCAETDSGKDITHAGSMTWNQATHNDSCDNEVYLSEYYCQDGEGQMERIRCTSFGLATCNAGQCESLPCNDSDGGNERGVAGSVFYDGDRDSDSCVSSGTLMEFYCTGSGVSSEVTDCRALGEVCWNEECSPSHCEDSDGGRDPYVVGHISMRSDNGYYRSWDDQCNGGTEGITVLENYCENGYVETVELSCGEEEYCKDGECVPEQCYDTDGGKEYYREGTVKKGVMIYNDDCDSKVLTEYYCDGNDVRSVEHICTGWGGCVYTRCYGVG